MAVSSGLSVVSTARLSATQQKMKTIEDALMAYRTVNDRLPCPGDLTLPATNTNYGLEAANPGSCVGGTPAANNIGGGLTNAFSTAAEGALPAITLGLAPDFMLDGWGNRFRYAVDISMTFPAGFSISPAGCNLGAITVEDASGNARTSTSIYALISHGPNGHGAYTKNGTIVNAGSVNTNEQLNCHCNSSATATTYAPTYVQRLPSLDASNSLDSFDDLVTYKERWQMMTPWDQTGSCSTLVIVGDSGNNRVQTFTLGGVYQSQFGTLGSANGQFNNPRQPLVDS
jgi:type II secretory pathway pseudopilin PulG